MRCYSCDSPDHFFCNAPPVLPKPSGTLVVGHATSDERITRLEAEVERLRKLLEGVR